MTSRDSFIKFHFANPGVEDRLAQVALTLRRSQTTRKKWSIWSVYHTLRDASNLALANGHAPYYARLLMRDYDRLTGFFSIRGKVELPEVPDGRTIIDNGLTLGAWVVLDDFLNEKEALPKDTLSHLQEA